MSSALRSKTVKKEALTRFVKPESPTYNNGLNRVLFPFSYSNQVLDISYAGNNFKEEMVDTLNQPPVNESTSTISLLGGLYLATTLGANFKAYIRAWRSATIDAGSPIEVVVAPQLIRVQEAEVINVNSTDGDVWLISTLAPTGDNYITGSTSNNYSTTYIFKTPLTFSIFEGGVKKYITFRTSLDQE